MLPAGPPGVDGVDVTDELWPLMEAWCNAATEHDDAWFEEHLDDDFEFLTVGGGVSSKARTIAMNTIVKNREYVLLDLVAQRYGDTVLGRGTYSARADIPPGSATALQIARYAAGAHVRFSTVWTLGAEGRLVCVLFQSTTIDA